MTIEAQLTRIADALERANIRAERPQSAGALPSIQPEDTPAEPEKPKSYVEQRKAEVTPPTQRPRGPQALKPTLPKPVKEPEKAVVKEPEAPPADDFLETPAEPAKAVTIDEVRAAVVKYRADKTKELGADKAKELCLGLLAKHGGGASILAGSAAAKLGDGSTHPGVLKPEFYAAVLAAIQA